MTENNRKILIDPRDKTHRFKDFKGLGRDGFQLFASSPDAAASRPTFCRK